MTITAKPFNNQTFSYRTNNHQVLPYYEIGTDGGRPVIKVFYDDGSYHYIDLTNGGLTSDAPGFVGSAGGGGTSEPTEYTVILSADGVYDIPTSGGSDGTFTLVGDFGGGVATLSYIIGGVSVAYDNSSLSANGGYALRWASDDNTLTLTGSTGASLTALACF